MLRPELLGAATAGSAPALYAFTLGLVAALNPCGFPLLPAYLAVFVGDGRAESRARRSAEGLAAGASVTAGFVVVFGLLGLAVQGGLTMVVGWVPWVMIPLGAGMAVLGLLALLGRAVALHLPMRRFGSGRGVLAMVGFGVAYAVASLSCALPLFLAGVAGSFGRLGFAQGTLTFVAYALGMGLLLMVASLAVAHAGVGALRRLRPLTRFVPRVAGLVLMVVGAYLVYYWAVTLVDPLATPPVVHWVDHVQSMLSGWLAHWSRPIGVGLGVVVVGALAATAAVGRNRRRDPRPQGGLAALGDGPAEGTGRA